MNRTTGRAKRNRKPSVENGHTLIDKIRLSGFTRYTTSMLRSSAMLGPSHPDPDTKVRCTVMMIRPCKTRDSARPALIYLSIIL
eukprot:scaffold110105_cov67-Phaeocystis_antarctica.AAC.4